MRETVEKAVGARANLSSANLSSANLSSADLSSANLRYANLSSADLSSADLRYANLSSADLHYANLSSADLRYANLSSANLRYADLSYANLSSADLRSADLRSADLSYANLSSVNLRYADLSYADLSSADLRSADLRYAQNYNLAVAMTRILPEGDLIGWKKARSDKGDVLIKLRIPERAKRSHAWGRKCRASEVVVLAIEGAETAWSGYVAEFTYAVGQTVTPTCPFDENWQEECASGIHFFITREEAEAHQL